MLKKSLMLLIIVVILSLMMLGTTGCGKSGSRFANQLPVIRITSYEGYDPNSDVYNVQDTLLFQQRVYWHAEDPDGTIAGYAYRILDANDNPIPTPGNKYYDADGSVTPAAVLSAHGDGWVLHYKPGADQNIPLDHPAASKTIWTSEKYVQINFPAANADGTPAVKISKFEVIAMDNRGGISNKAMRFYTAWSAKPVCFVQTTKGDPRGSQVGTGLRLSFSMDDDDPFIQATPWYYEFKINKRQGIYNPPETDSTLYDDSINPILSSTRWYSSYGLPKINQALLTTMSDPAIFSDYDANGNQVTHTEVVARVYDLAGIVSDTLKYRTSDGAVIGKTAIRFAVKEGFRPSTDIYPTKSYGLGDHHFVDYQDEGALEIYPFTIVGGAQRYATPFFRNTENERVAINSPNFKAWVRWGWWGEYAQVNSAGISNPTHNPYDKKVDAVLDETTDQNYYSEITHFDLRFNGDAYDFPPLAQNIITDSDTGKRWLRIPLNSPLGQTVVLTTLPSGEHTFEVRVVDLQGMVDPTPETFTFKLVDYIPATSRNGILIVDDEANHPSFAPDAIITEKMEYALSGYNQTKDFIIRSSDSNPGDTYGDIRSRHLAPSDLQKYKMVIHHSNHPQAASTLPIDHDGLYLYSHMGGNLVFSGTHLMSSMFDSMAAAGQYSFMQRLGLLAEQSVGSSLLGNNTGIQNNTFFQRAIGQLTFPNLYVQYEDQADLTNYPIPGHNSIVNSRKGLSAVTFFTKFNGEPIYSLGCKPVNYPSSPPTQDQYNQFNNQAVGIRKVNSAGKSYLFGFPFAYMHQEGLKAMMNKILAETM